jgi:hypothetical protein
MILTYGTGYVIHNIQSLYSLKIKHKSDQDKKLVV